MDPLHPLVPITPPPPAAPTHTRVERIQRDGQRDPGPDWQRGSDEESEDAEQDQFEDDYDPDWSDPAAAEPYGPDGALHHDPAAAVDLTPAPEPQWDPRVDRNRRAQTRDQPDDADQDPGPHIDISA